MQVVGRKGRKQANDEIWIELPTGEQRSVPVEWTDQGEREEYPEGVYFPVRNLQQLQEALERLKTEREQGMMAEEEGGNSHDTGRSSRLAGNASRKAAASDRDPGANAAAGDSGQAGRRGER